MLMDVTLYNTYGIIEKGSEIEMIPVPKEEADWKKDRKKTIGGSEAAAILGLNKYSSPLKVYRSKTENKEDEEDMLARLPSVKKGRELESWILDNKVKPSLPDYDIIKPDHMFKNVNYPWLMGNLDGVGTLKGKTYNALKDTIGIEIKLVTEYGEAAWNGPDYEGIPSYYYVQVQTYMAITGISVFYVCAMFESNWELKMYKIPKDLEFIHNKLLPETKKFYDNHLVMNIPPAPTPSIDSDEITNILPDIENTPTVSSEELDKMLEDYNSLDSVIRASETRLNILKDNIISKYIEGARPTETSKSIISYSKVTRPSFDSNKFKEENPDLYQKYTNPSSYVKWNIKKPKR